jgi:hypothetical protein
MMEKLYSALRLYKKDTRAVQAEMSKPSADNEARRNIFDRVNRMSSDDSPGQNSEKVQLSLK